MENQPIVVEQTFQVHVDRLWKAITDKHEMPKWFFAEIPDFNPVAGFETKFNVRAENQNYLHLWKLKEVIPGKKIVYGWRYEGIPGDSTVTWELSQTPKGSTLKITHSGSESFPQDQAVFSREAGQAGWEYFVKNSLKKYLEG
jgi:uncharacterized protein YndB with AHSA1/START domain